jgi:hypothetical protein
VTKRSDGRRLRGEEKCAVASISVAKKNDVEAAKSEPSPHREQCAESLEQAPTQQPHLVGE